MIRPTLCAILFIAAASAASAPSSKPVGGITAKVTVLDDASKLRAFRDLKEGSKLTPINRSLEKGVIRYTLGNHQSNQYLLAKNLDQSSYGSPQDVVLKLEYPTNGEVGGIISSVEIIVDQSSNAGQAYVVAGGIGQRFIAVVVEAYNTRWFNHEAYIYGY